MKWAVISVVGLCGFGCMSSVSQPVTEAPADARLADPEFWWTQPSAETVEASDFDTLWHAAERSARDLLFPIDRRDYRLGILSTEPVVSSQFFEPWRRELSSADQVAESSLASVRRTIRFEFERSDAGYTVTPKVLVERYALAERQISSSALTRLAFARRTQRGTRESDEGLYLPDRYWYATGRDTALEQRLADMIRTRIGASAQRD